MSNTDRTERGITPRHARACRHRESRCTCTPTFQVQVWDAQAAKRITRTFPTITTARRWRQDAIVALRRGELTAERGPTLADYAAQWLDNARAGVARNRSGHAYKPSAIRSYEKALRLRVLPDLGRLRVREITTRDVQRFVDALVRAGWEPATIGVCVTALGSLYRHAVARGDAAVNPTRGIEKPAVRSKERRIVAPEMAQALLTALPAEHRPLWATAFYAGLRKGELIGLRWDDVDLAAHVLHVRHSWDPKEGDIDPKSRHGTRDVPIPEVLREFLIGLRLGATDQRVFGSAKVVRRHARAAPRRWRELDLPDLTLHEARHTYASTMIAAGVNAKALSSFMGHGSIGITYDLYGHLMPGAQEQAADLLDAYLAQEAGGSTAAPTAAHPAESQS